MELCRIAPEQLYKKQLPEGSRDAMVKFATLRPDEKKTKIAGIVGIQSYPLFSWALLTILSPIATVDAKL